MDSATPTLAFQEGKLKIIKVFNDNPLLISAARSLLSYCTVIPKPEPKFGYGLGWVCVYSLGIFGLGTPKVQNKVIIDTC